MASGQAIHPVASRLHPVGTEFQQHPLSAAWPRMERSEFAGLVKDIAENGQTVPAVLFDGMVLDGWNRYLACREAKVSFETEDLDPGVDPRKFVLSLNRNRRHCTPGQNAVAVTRVMEWRPRGGRPEEVQSAPGADCKPDQVLPQPIVTTQEMAKMAGVSPRTIEQAKVVVKAGLADKVRDGEMSVKKAAAVATEKVAEVAKDAIEKAQRKAKDDPRDAEIERLKARVTELEAELETLRGNAQVLADELDSARVSIDPDVFEKVKALKVYQRVVERQRDDYMRQNAALKREVKSLQRKLGE